FFFFFFQAEDGIRDYKVTGVQTCALPIYRVRELLAEAARAVEVRAGDDVALACEQVEVPAEVEVGRDGVVRAAVDEHQQRVLLRSEERRVGKEGRSRRAPDD